MWHIVSMHNIYPIDHVIPRISKFKQKKNLKFCPEGQNQLKIRSKAFTQSFNQFLFLNESLWDYLSTTSYFI